MPKTKFDFTIPEDAAARLERVASEDGSSVDEVIHRALEFHVGLPEVARMALANLVERGTPEDYRELMDQVALLVLDFDTKAMLHRIDGKAREEKEAMDELAARL